jgi:molybdate transport system substrate-binding protein
VKPLIVMPTSSINRIEGFMNALKILSAGAVKRGVAQLAAAYSAERKVPVSVEFATAPELRQRMTNNAAADVLVAPPAVMDEVATAVGIVEGSRVFIGRSRMGVVVHSQSSVTQVPDGAAFRRMLADASMLVHNTASSGIYAAKMLSDMGLTRELGSRRVVVNTGAAVMEHVAQHPPDAIGLAQISEIRVLIDKGLPVRMAGPLPDAVQNITRYEAAAIVRDKYEAAVALAAFLATPEARRVFAASGID